MAGADRSSVLKLYSEEDKVDDGFKFQIDNKQAAVEMSCAGAAQEMKFDAPAYKYKKADDTFFSLEQRFADLENATTGADNAAAIAALQSSLAQEINDRTALDVAHGNNLTAELNARVSADQVIQQNLDDYEASNDAAVADVDAKIDQEIADRTSAVSAERAATQAQVDALQSQITNILSDATPQVLDDLASIVSAFQAADQTLTSNLASLVTRMDAVEAIINQALGQSL